jgi:hypothetical protein
MRKINQNGGMKIAAVFLAKFLRHSLTKFFWHYLFQKTPHAYLLRILRGINYTL